MDCTTVGVDIAKNVFQVHYVDRATGEIVNKPIKRAKFLEHFANRAPCLIGMEACGGAHHWARQLTKMGHQVKLMPAEFVKAFNVRNKNDAADARAIWLAAQQPSKAVAVKTEMQQAMLALHRMRQGSFREGRMSSAVTCCTASSCLPGHPMYRLKILTGSCLRAREIGSQASGIMRPFWHAGLLYWRFGVPSVALSVSSYSGRVRSTARPSESR